MPIPFAAALIGGGAATVLDYALGRPLNLWGRSIDAAQTPQVRNSSYNANVRWPNILPAPDAIIECARRGMLSNNVAEWALNDQGIAWSRTPAGISPEGGASYDAYRRLWEQVGKMRRSRPDPATLSRLMVSGRAPADKIGDMTQGYDADWTEFNAVHEANYAMPGLMDVLQLRRLGKISQADYDQAARQLGWYNAEWVRRQEQVTPLPNLYTLLRDYYLGLVSAEQYSKYAQALGHTDLETLARVESTFYQMPSGPELVQLAVRDAWNADVVQRWGYDAEFPEELLFFLKAQGWDWGVAFTDRQGRRVPGVHWPQLFWRAHWAVISPGQAYQAYRRLRPNRLDRYVQDFPRLTAFTLDDLNTVLKVHDYPPAARDWLGAISSQPLRMSTIRYSYQRGVRDRTWALEQLADSGYVRQDAEAILDLIDADQDWKDRQAINNIARSLVHQTANEVVAGYSDGFVPRDEAVQRLSRIGWGAGMVTRALDLADSKRLRSDLRQALSVLRREYLAGAYSDAELLQVLLTYRVSAVAAQRYLSRWQGLRSLERRTASTQQILAWVREGSMPPAAAQIRLANLGWVGGDALIMVQSALHRLEAHEAQVATHVAHQQAANAKALQAQVKSGLAAVKSAQAALSRLTPRATIEKWVKEGIVSPAWAILRLEAMGYDRADIDRYLAQWAEEQAKADAKAGGGKASKPSSAPVPPRESVTGRPPGS